MALSTHRLVQLHALLDLAEAESRAHLRRAGLAAAVGNAGAHRYFLSRWSRFERLVLLCLARLEAAL